ncbi:MAG: hypothetical protein GX491_06255 [Chloroflexi bacterium]|nr:hypothetical protein [Chloroflexota bacterium]
MNFKRWMAVLICLVWVLGLVPAASAQADQPQMTVTPAYSGYFKYGEWLPVWIELENQGRDLDGEVRVQVSGSQGTLVFAAEVSLPSGSRKQFPIYVLPNNFSRELQVRLVSGGKTVATQKVTVRPQPNITFMAGILAPERGAISLLNGIHIPGQERPKVLVDLTLAELPDRAEALRSFDLLIINDIDTSNLSAEQAEALESWVHQGGHLVIGGGSSAQQVTAGLPESLLPLRVTGTVETGSEDLTELSEIAGSPVLLEGPFVIARGEAVNSATVIGEADLPLVQERAAGAGVVDFVTLDLAGVPFSGWPGTQALWETLVSSRAVYPEYLPFDVSPRQFRAQSLTYALSNIPTLDLPSIQGLGVLLSIYILVVGPLNYLFLRWRKKMQLAWVTIPVLTVLFTAGAFGIGYAMRGSDLVLNKIAVVSIQPGGDAEVTSYMGLFSPSQTSYEVLVDGEGLVSPMTGYDGNPWNSAAMPVSGSEMVFVQGQGKPSRVKGLTVNQWSMQSFMSEGSWPGFGELTGDLSIDNETLVGFVRNETGYTLTDVVVTVQGRFARLGDMAPGEEKEVSLGLSNLQSDRFGSPLSYRLFYEPANARGGMPSREAELKSNIVSGVLENYSVKRSVNKLSPAVGATGSITVFGWMKEAPPAVEVANSGLSQQATVLVHTTLDFQTTKDGYMILPPGLVPGVITELPVNGGTCGPTGVTSVYMGRGEAHFEYQIPASLDNFQVDTLKLAFWRDSGGQWVMPDISLYKWTEDAWIAIQEPIEGTNIIKDASDYVNENGIVRVKMSTENDTFGCIYLDMGVEAHSLTGRGG